LLNPFVIRVNRRICVRLDKLNLTEAEHALRFAQTDMTAIDKDMTDIDAKIRDARGF
jgi:hypothetical protein